MAKLINDILHKRASDVKEGEVFIPILEQMWEILLASKSGVGLAAPQIGVGLRIIIVKTKDFELELINPEIYKLYGGQITSKEGCLSFPGKVATVVRYKQCIVQGYDRNWNPIRRKLKGFNAIVVQHECDHLDGITIMDSGWRELN